MKTQKEIALDFLRLAAKGDSREAFRLYTGPDFRHHNVWFKGDGDTLMAAMAESAKMNPDKIFNVQRALEDGDLVAVHSHVRQNPEEKGVAVIHIFRFENGKIAELWDFGQPVPDETINKNGMF
jgi:predicted SnoaL-like aldol condensation-catalyzing enzyme